MAEKDNSSASMKTEFSDNKHAQQQQQLHRHMVVVSGLGTAEAFANGAGDKEGGSNGHIASARATKVGAR